jgi:poly-gamma-glutamate synthesis protein (capsule biosynthesis protein)
MTLGLLTLAIGVTLGASATAEEAIRSQAVTLSFGGDVFIDSPIQNTLHRRSYVVGRLQAYQELLADVAPTLGAADLTVVNLETPVSPRYRDRGSGESPTFNAPPELLQALVDAGVDAVALANNHAYDQGYRGLQDTVDLAKRLGLAVVGVGRTAEEAPGPITLSTPRGDVSICAWTEGVNRVPRPDEAEELTEGTEPLRVALVDDGTLADCLSRARARSKLVVASLHWTSGVWSSPGRRERSLVLQVADAGADVIMGHGSHRPAPAVQVRASDGHPVQVIFSLGNMVGAMGLERHEWASTHPSVRDAALASVKVGPSGGRLVPEGLEMIQIWMSGIMPSAPWWTDGRQELIRPLSVSREFERLASAKCGELCQQRTEGYQRRLDAFREALSLEGPWPERPVPHAPATTVAAATPPGLEPEAVPEPEPARAVTQPEPTAPSPRTVTGSDQLDLDALRAGITMPMEFPHNQVIGVVRDAALIERIVELIQDHRQYRVELIGHGVDGESVMPLDRLGRRRARSAAWEISSRGPSRSRVNWQNGPPLPAGSQGRVVLQVREP